MRKLNRKNIHTTLVVLISIAAVIDFVLLLKYFMSGRNIALLNPGGWVAQQEMNLMVFVVLALLAIGIPTLILLYFVAWKYRESNTNSDHKPNAKASKALFVSMWLVPGLFAILIASVMWPATHQLVPQEALAHKKDPMTIQVVSMNWKWLFIYPEQEIATVNFVQFPVDTPITFELTADQSPMSSFWIPNLGGQLYSMTTHVNRLNLIAEKPGDYPGNSAEINGSGFAGMKFIARASSQNEFDTWVNEVKSSTNELGMEEYNDLLEPSEYHPVTFYSAYETNLFAKVIQKYYEPQATKGHEE